MKRVLFIIGLVGFMQLSCKKTHCGNQEFTSSLDGKWRMITVIEASGNSISKPASLAKDVDITFSSSNTTGGTLYGVTPTNEISPSSFSTDVNRSLTITCLNMTKVQETSWGNKFVVNIVLAKQYTFFSGGELAIITTGKTLVFRRL